MQFQPNPAVDQNLMAESRLEAGETSGATPWKASAMATLVAAAQLTGGLPLEPRAFVGIQPEFGHHSETNVYLLVAPRLTSLEHLLFGAINDLYDLLLKRSHELDTESHRVLHERRWDLYE